MDLFVLDDSKQRTPTREGMGPLVAVGGLHVPSDAVGQLERALELLCDEFEFPAGAEFKWSPGKELWMHKQFRGPPRTEFFARALQLAADSECTALIVIADEKYRHAIATSASAEDDAVAMFLERAQASLQESKSEALLLFDRPSGDRRSEVEFLARCLTTMRAGTTFVLPDRLTLAVATQSRLVRLLQLADLVTSNTLQHVAGSPYARATFESVRPLLRGGGGVGLKIHPDAVYRNLYHWFLDDYYLIRHGRIQELPAPGKPYAESPDRP